MISIELFKSIPNHHYSNQNLIIIVLNGTTQIRLKFKYFDYLIKSIQAEYQSFYWNVVKINRLLIITIQKLTIFITIDYLSKLFEKRLLFK